MRERGEPRRPGTASTETWPALPLTEWRETYATLHMMTQVVGKVRLARAPMINHWWQVPLYLTARGLSTSPIPHDRVLFQMEFDFLDHSLRIEASDGGARAIELRSRPVAHFYADVMRALDELGVPVKIWPRPVEIEDPIPFDRDHRNVTYEPEHAHRFWGVLGQADRVLGEFRSRFVGKCSPVHFFWGSFDLAVTRFSGRRAPAHPGGVPNLADRVTREAYSRECSSVGFWPGSGAVQEAAFYAYAYPEPEGYADHPVRPAGAFYSREMREFILPYDAVRAARNPDGVVLDFCQDTYGAAAVASGWDRNNLERDDPATTRPADPDEASTFPRHDDDARRRPEG